MKQTVAFLPGLLCDADLFTAQIAAMQAAGHNTHVADFAGEDQVSIPAMAARLIDELPERFSLVALSMGGYVALEVLAQAPERVERVWSVVRAARDAAVEVIAGAIEAGRPVSGYHGDRAARQVIENEGFGEFFVHRTGHSIDRELHGSGPHLDDYETHDARELMPGVGFSIEPGIYLPGEFGVRSEINMYWGPEGPVVTPEEPQENLILPG